MRTKHAREIGPFRYSGLNQPGYSRPPQLAAAPRTAPGVAVSLGTPSAAQRVRERVNAAPDVTMTDPPRTPADVRSVSVQLDGAEARVPQTWRLAFAHAKGRDMLYALEPSGTLHVLVASADGEIRELAGLPGDLVADLTRQHFPWATR